MMVIDGPDRSDGNYFDDWPENRRHMSREEIQQFYRGLYLSTREEALRLFSKRPSTERAGLHLEAFYRRQDTHEALRKAKLMRIHDKIRTDRLNREFVEPHALKAHRPEMNT